MGWFPRPNPNLSPEFATRQLRIAQLFLLLAILGVVYAAFFAPHPPPSSPPTPMIPSRDVIAQASHLHEKWRARAPGIGLPGNPHIQWARDGLVFASPKGQLVLLDSQSGQMIWRVPYGSQADALVTDDKRIYLISEWRIGAYSLKDGRLLWQTENQPQHQNLDLYLKDNFLLEYMSREENIRIFDTETGELLFEETAPEGLSINAVIQHMYLGKAGNFLYAVNFGTKKIMWQIPTNTFMPVESSTVAGSSLAVTEGDNLLVLDLNTGMQYWWKQGVISNPAVLGDTVYVMAEDASLRAYYLANGYEAGIVSTMPATTTIQRGYELAVNPVDELIYAYYGDSEEIIAFGR